MVFLQRVPAAGDGDLLRLPSRAQDRAQLCFPKEPGDAWSPGMLGNPTSRQPLKPFIKAPGFPPQFIV